MKFLFGVMIAISIQAGICDELGPPETETQESVPKFGAFARFNVHLCAKAASLPDEVFHGIAGVDWVFAEGLCLANVDRSLMARFVNAANNYERKFTMLNYRLRHKQLKISFYFEFLQALEEKVIEEIALLESSLQRRDNLSQGSSVRFLKDDSDRISQIYKTYARMISSFVRSKTDESGFHQLNSRIRFEMIERIGNKKFSEISDSDRVSIVRISYLLSSELDEMIYAFARPNVISRGMSLKGLGSLKVNKPNSILTQIDVARRDGDALVLSEVKKWRNPFSLPEGVELGDSTFSRIFEQLRKQRSEVEPLLYPKTTLRMELVYPSGFYRSAYNRLREEGIEPVGPIIDLN